MSLGKGTLFLIHGGHQYRVTYTPFRQRNKTHGRNRRMVLAFVDWHLMSRKRVFVISFYSFNVYINLTIFGYRILWKDLEIFYDSMSMSR